MKTKLSLSVVALLLLSLAGCRSEYLQLFVSGETYPQFRVIGRQALFSFWIQEFDPKLEKRVGDLLWSFEKKSSAPRALTLSEIGEFRYGDVPSDVYDQRTPNEGSKPKALYEGKWYKAEILTADKYACQVLFQIQSGKVSNAKTIYVTDNNQR